MKRGTTLFTSSLIYIAGLVLFTGCGNMGASPRVPKKTVSRYASHEAGDNWEDDGSSSLGGTEYDCPSSPNVEVDYNPYYDGSGRYKLCVHESSRYKVKIQESRYIDEQVCAFPIEYLAVPGNDDIPVGDMKFSFKIDQSGGPMFKCVNTSDGAALLDFNLTNYNGMIVVKLTDKNQMRSCLQYGSVDCPSFVAHGKFR